MTLLLLSYLGGVLTILSPCILPVLPFVFARSDQPFVKSGLPLLIGMAVTFAGVATLAAVGGGWAVHANQYGRIVALVVLGAFGVLLLFPSIADRVTQPLVALGDRLSRNAGSGIGASLLLGVATGLLWAPCAGPILGLVLTGAAIQGASANSTLLLLAYAAGAATSLAVALLIGGRVFAAMKKSLGAGEWIRRALGAAVLAGVVAIALGLDTGLLTRLSTASTASLEQSLVDTVDPHATAPVQHIAGSSLPVEGTLPSLAGATGWINTTPLTREALRGKIVVIDFWTYSCINCLRSLPYVKAWAEKYRNQGVVVIGVHSPEFAFERDPDNVRKAVHDLGITYPVAIDSNLAIWLAFHNQYWPAHYFIDGEGRIRGHHFGEGGKQEAEHIIQTLLKEAGRRGVPSDLVKPDASGALAASNWSDIGSPETYVGYARAANFASGAGVIGRDIAADYPAPVSLALNQWGLAGNWTVGPQVAVLNRTPGAVVFRFHARDLNFVLGPANGKTPVRFRVTLDGKAPGARHGVDTDADGNGTVTGQRLYQLIRQMDASKAGRIEDHTFAIEFLDPGVQAYSFTFG